MFRLACVRVLPLDGTAMLKIPVAARLPILVRPYVTGFPSAPQSAVYRFALLGRFRLRRHYSAHTSMTQQFTLKRMACRK
jgi:hypothetical protein